jgi:hypothetical protein
MKSILNYLTEETNAELFEKTVTPHSKILSKLFEDFSSSKKYKILDTGSGRTSLTFLTNKFPKSIIQAIVYPGDTRKTGSIKEYVRKDNYKLQEVDLYKFKQDQKFDIVLSHLLLGEATKFSKESFDKMTETLFNIKTKFLIVIDILEDQDVNYRTILLNISKKGQIQKVVFEDKYIGFLIRMENNS